MDIIGVKKFKKRKVYRLSKGEKDMVKTNIITSAFNDETDCFIINFLKSTITYCRNNDKVIEIMETEALGNQVSKLIDIGIKKCALDMRAADLKGILIIGRSKGFNKVVKEMDLEGKIKPIGIR